MLCSNLRSNRRENCLRIEILLIKHAERNLTIMSESQSEEHPRTLGPARAAGVVITDVKSSDYYVGGILGSRLGSLAGLFIWQTMIVFTLLGIKYSEVCHRYPRGGGIFSICSHAFNKWVGVFAALCISVSYVLTMAISAVSAAEYMENLLPFLKPWTTVIAVGIVLLIMTLNLSGIKESATVSTVISIVGLSALFALIITTVIHIGPGGFLHLFPEMFQNIGTLTFVTFLAGFGGSFLAFSGLESISQLSKDMVHPVKRTAKRGLGIVVVLVLTTAPVLGMMVTTLLPVSILKNDDLNSQLLGILAGKYGGQPLAIYVGINGICLLIFAVCTAMIGFYRLTGAMTSKKLLPAVLGKTTKKKHSPWAAILLATFLAISVILIANGNLFL